MGLPSRPWEERFEALEERILRLTAGKSRKDRGRIARRERENPIRLVSEVTYDQAAELETRMETYPGLQVVERLKREYPQGSAGGHVVGYVGKMRDDQYGAREAAGYFREELVTVIGEDEYAKRERLGEFKDDIVGAEGVEAWFDQPAADEPFRQLLRGRRGAMIQQRDLTSRTREILQHAPPTAGTDLRLTLDLRLQRSVEEALAGLLASAVVLDVRTGELLALVSTPGFDPNDFVPPASAAVVEPLLTRKDHPLLNRAVMSAYPLGSIFKVVTASAGLEERKFEPSTEFTCEGRFRTQPPYFRCWISAHGGAHGPQDLLHALMHSCNVFFCNVGQRVGGEALTGWARRFGLGRRTGVDLRGERAGGLPGRSRVTGAPHTLNPNEVLNLSIGQGQIEVTPIQVAVLMAAVANGGSVLRPILWRDDPRSRAPVDVLPLGRATLEAIRAGLAAVVMEPGGTAAKTDLRKFHAAGKTSTAEVTSSETARQLPAFYPHAWFAGYAPLEAPRFAFVVMIEHGGKGSEAAAPKAAEVLARVFARFPE
ncbi:MAG: hypothetical protein HYZ53_10890 [Planctomycetes bacterium]|nr:hypothetical protein [Planctomycetota bacterium]